VDDTPNLGLPYILAAQSQKHVTHNEAIRALDAVVQLAVLDRDLATPPLSPAEGDRYIVAAGPTGDWEGEAGKVAAFQDGAWAFLSPNEGWIAWIADEEAAVVWSNSSWTALTAASGGRGEGDFSTVGINATADAANRLSVSSPAVLLNHEGAGHQLKINKAAAGDTASLLYQTAFSGRAEIGTAGDDDFHFKVSPDGSNWNEAIVINSSTGVVTFPFTTFAGLVWRGPWVASTSYAVNDAVENDGASYVCRQAHTSGSNDDEPGVGANAATYWELLAAKGLQGSEGPAGPPGATGATGPQGPTGADGQDGAQGPQGPAGADGQDGAQGPQGPQGPAGNDGADGAQGPQGPAGLVWQGAWATATAYAVDDAVENNGSSFVCIQGHSSGSDDDEPGVGANTATYWGLLAAKGADAMNYAEDDLISGFNAAAMTNLSDTEIIAAQGAGARIYVTQITVHNAHASVDTGVAIKDGTTEIYRIPASSVYGGATLNFSAPLRLSDNTALQAACLVTGASVHVSASGFKKAG